MSPPPPSVDRLLAAARGRLAQRRALRGAVTGASVGLAASGLAVGLRLLGLIGPVPAVAIAGASPLVAAALGALIARSRGDLAPRELGLLVDRALGTEESVLTALHLRERGGLPPALERQVEQAGQRAAELAARLPLLPPRRTRALVGAWLVLGVLAAGVPPLLAPWFVSVRDGGVPSEVAAEGERLAERLAELQEREGTGDGEVLPETLQREVADLAADLQGEQLSTDEAMERLSDLDAQLQRFTEELEPSERLLDELQQAASELDASSTDALAEALSRGDLEQAAAEAGDLAEALSQATPEQQREAAEALQQAGEAMQQSGDPGLQQAGEAMEQAGRQLQEQARGGEPGATGEQGAPGSGGPQGNGPGAEQLEAMQRALEQQRDLGERLERDREKLEQARQMQGAVQGAQERMGGPDGEGSTGQGAGEGEGEGEGEGGQGVAMEQGMGGGAGAGAGHTWEDEGEFTAEQAFQDGAAQTREGGGEEAEHIDDFEQFYAPHRIDDAQALLAAEEGSLDEGGQIDTLVTRLTESDETAERPTLQLPDTYREAATEAIEAERIPPAYREAVKAYFE